MQWDLCQPDLPFRTIFSSDCIHFYIPLIAFIQEIRHVTIIFSNNIKLIDTRIIVLRRLIYQPSTKCLVFKFVVIFRTLEGIIFNLFLMWILYSKAFIVPKYIFLMTVYYSILEALQRPNITMHLVSLRRWGEEEEGALNSVHSLHNWDRQADCRLPWD